jgi:hypothetical protein
MRELKILEERYLLGVSSRTSGASRLLDATELRMRIAECRAETGPAIDNVGKEIGFAKMRLQRSTEEKEELEAEGREILRRARQEVIGMVVEDRGLVAGGGR